MSIRSSHCQLSTPRHDFIQRLKSDESRSEELEPRWAGDVLELQSGTRPTKRLKYPVSRSLVQAAYCSYFLSTAFSTGWWRLLRVSRTLSSD